MSALQARVKSPGSSQSGRRTGGGLAPPKKVPQKKRKKKKKKAKPVVLVVPVVPCGGMVYGESSGLSTSRRAHCCHNHTAMGNTPLAGAAPVPYPYKVDFSSKKHEGKLCPECLVASGGEPLPEGAPFPPFLAVPFTPLAGTKESKMDAWRRCVGKEMPTVTITVAAAMAKCGLKLQPGSFVPPGTPARDRTSVQTFAVLAGGATDAAAPAGTAEGEDEVSRVP